MFYKIWELISFLFTSISWPLSCYLPRLLSPFQSVSRPTSQSRRNIPETQKSFVAMWVSSLAVYTLVLQNTFAAAAFLGNLAAVKQTRNEIFVVEKRMNCQGRGNFVVYESTNDTGGSSMVCINDYVAAACLILFSGGGNVIEALMNKVTSWITSKVEDASADGPPAIRRIETLSLEANDGREDQLFTWADLYAYQAVNGSLKYEAPEILHTTSNTVAVTAGHVAEEVTAMELHEDGFSFTGIPLDNGDGDISKRANCYEQIHVHYWANDGHYSTLLSSVKIGNLVRRALNHAYAKDYEKSCYEMTDNGNWDGFLRVCFNHNTAQSGCYTCGGHSN